MEKFGIFELLDTLSAFAAPDTEQKAEETREEEAAKGSEERWRDGEETVSGESG